MDFTAWPEDRLLLLWDRVLDAMSKGDERITGVTGLSGSMSKTFVTDPVAFHNAVSDEIQNRGLSQNRGMPNEATVDFSKLRGVS